MFHNLQLQQLVMMVMMQVNDAQACVIFCCNKIKQVSMSGA